MTGKIVRKHGTLDTERCKTLSSFETKRTQTIEEIAANGVRSRYIYKIIFQLRLQGYDFKANREGRKVVSYTYLGVRKPREFRAAMTLAA